MEDNKPTASLNTTQISGLSEAQAAQAAKPATVSEAISTEMVKAISLMFPGIGLFIQAMKIAKSARKNVVVPLIFCIDGRVLIQEPIVRDADPKDIAMAEAIEEAQLNALKVAAAARCEPVQFEELKESLGNG